MSVGLRKKHLLAAKFAGGTMTYQQKIVADGANHYWRLSEIAGNYIDSIGGLDGIPSGGIQRGVPGAVTGNVAARFVDDIAASRVDIPSITLPIPFSIECWVKTLDATHAAGNFVFTNRNGTISSNVYLSVSLAGKIEFGPNTALITSVATVNNGQWHHVVCTVSGTQATAYIDGVLDIQQAKTVGVTTGAGIIGFDVFAGFAIDTSIDELALYPLILTPTQVAAHFALR